MIHYRQANPSDIPAIVAMAAKFIQSMPESVWLRVEADRLATVAGYTIANGVIWLAEDELDDTIGRKVTLPAGMIAIVAIAHPFTGDFFGDEFAWWVEPAYRNSSVGPKLLRRAEDWARQKGLTVLKMVAPAGSTVGKFYAANGYVEVESTYVKHLQKAA